jgi:hypothetical protein
MAQAPSMDAYCLRCQHNPAPLAPACNDCPIPVTRPAAARQHHRQRHLLWWPRRVHRPCRWQRQAGRHHRGPEQRHSCGQQGPASWQRHRHQPG